MANENVLAVEAGGCAGGAVSTAAVPSLLY
jgi:hypothetical protein